MAKATSSKAYLKLRRAHARAIKAQGTIKDIIALLGDRGDLSELCITLARAADICGLTAAPQIKDEMKKQSLRDEGIAA